MGKHFSDQQVQRLIRMGTKAQQFRRVTRRTIRRTPLTEAQRTLLAGATYEGNPVHKRNPGDFGLTPPASPRPDKTLCDEAGIFKKAEARRLLHRGIEHGLVSETADADGFPKEIWVVDEGGNVFEAIHGGSTKSAYHGYPIRRSDPFY